MKRDKVLTIRLTAAERKQLETAAARRGLPVSADIRRLALMFAAEPKPLTLFPPTTTTCTTTGTVNMVRVA